MYKICVSLFIVCWICSGYFFTYRALFGATLVLLGPSWLGVGWRDSGRNLTWQPFLND